MQKRQNRWWVTVILSVLIIAAVILLLLFRPNCAEIVNEYTITFISRNAEEEGIVHKTIKVKHGENIPFEEVETPQGYELLEDGYVFEYTFTGWYKEGDSEDNLVEGQVTATEDASYIAAYIGTPKGLDSDTFLVRFYDSVTGKLMVPVEGEAVQTVKRGENAVAPTAPEHEGYDYPPEWSHSFEGVTGNLKITARYMPSQYNINKHILGEVETDKEYFNMEMRPASPGDRGMLKFVDWYWTSDFSGEPVSESALMEARDMNVYAKYRIDFAGVVIAHVGGDFEYGGEEETLLLDGMIPDGRLEYTCEWTAVAPDKTTSDKTAGGEGGTTFTLSNASGRDIAGEYSVQALVKAKYKSPDGAEVLVSDEITVKQNFSLGKRAVSAEIMRSGSSFTYGTAPDVSINFSGFQYDDSPSLFNDKYVFTYNNGASVLKEKLPVGNYTVSAEIEETDNYSVNIVNDNAVTVRIDRKDLNVILETEDFTYGDGEVTSHFSIDYDTFVYGEREDAQNIIGEPIYAYTLNNQSYNASAHTYVDAGAYTVKITGFTKVPNGNVGLNYAVNWRDATSRFNVDKRSAEVSLEVGKDTLTYGEEQTYEIDDGEILEEDRSSFKWNFTFTFNSADGTKVNENYTYNNRLFDAGEYTLTAACSEQNSNYNSILINGNGKRFTVGRKKLNISARTNGEYVYGDDVNASPVFDGLVESGVESSDLKASDVKYGFTKENSEYVHDIFGAGKYSVKYVSGYTSNNYDITAGEPFEFTVSPKTLNITLSTQDGKSEYYYGDNPEILITFAEDEFVGEDGKDKDALFGDKYSDFEYFKGSEKYSGDYFNANAEYSVEIGLKNNRICGNNEYGTGNYKIKVNKLTFKSAPRPVTLTLTANGSTYGEEAPEYSYKNTSDLGFIGNDEQAFGFDYVLNYTRFNESGSHDFTPADGSLYPAGQYHVTLKYSENSNYKIDVVSASFDVSRRAVTVDLSATGITYGDEANFTYTYTQEGESNGVLTADKELFESAYKYSLTKNGSPYTHSGRYYGAGDYVYNATFASEESNVSELLKNYDISYADSEGVKFTVSKKALALYVTFEDIVYGQKVTAPVPVAGGFAAGEGLSNLGGKIEYTLNGTSYTAEQFAAEPIPVANYTILIKADCFKSENYDISYNKNTGGGSVSDTFIVSKRNATVSAVMKSDGEYVYGGANKPKYEYVFTVEPLANGKESFELSAQDTAFAFNLDVKYSNDKVNNAAYVSGNKYNAGEYTVTVVAAASDPNFNIKNTNNKLTFTVKKAKLNVSLKGVAESYEYGVAVAPEVEFTGFITEYADNFETAGIELVRGANRTDIFRYKNGSGNLNSVKNVGNYSAFIANDSATYYKSENYDFTYDAAEHNFKITPKTLNVNFEKSTDKDYENLIYGDVPGTLSLYRVAFNGKDMAYGESAETLFSRYDRTVAYYVGEQRCTPAAYFNAGSYTLKVVGLNDGETYGNYVLKIAEEGFAVKKRVLSVSEVNGTTFEYDGSEHRIQQPVKVDNVAQGEANEAAYSLAYNFEEGKNYKDAASYTVTFKVTPTSNYEVGNYGGSYTVTISKRAITLSAQASDGTYGDFYAEAVNGGRAPVTQIKVGGKNFANGESFDQIGNPAITLFRNSKKYELSASNYYDAGKYTVKLNDIESGAYSYGNYDITVIECGFTIAPKEIKITGNQVLPRLKGERWTWTYSKSEGDFFEFTGSVKLKSVSEDKYSANGESDFNKYFEWEGGSYDIKVNGISVKENFVFSYNLSLMLNNSNFEITTPESKVYNGSEQSFAIEVTTGESEIEGLYTIQYSENGTGDWQTNAPEFKDVITKTWHYQIISTYSSAVETNGTFDIVITPKALTVEKPTDVSRDYNNKAEEVKPLKINGVIEGEENPYTISNKVSGNTSDGSIVNAGSYTVTYNVELTSENYSLSVKEYSYNVEISKAKLIIDNSGVTVSGLKYNGDEQTIPADELIKEIIVKQNGESVDFAKVTVSGNTFKNVNGTNTLTFAFAESDNYYGDSVTQKYNVEKADYTVTPDLKELTYNGRTQSYGVTVKVYNQDVYTLKYSYNGDEVNISESANFINAATYNISYTVTDNVNYNDILNGKYEFTIKPKEITVNKPSDVAETYDGKPHGASVSFTGYEDITEQISDVYENIAYTTDGHGETNQFKDVLRENGEVSAYVISYTVTLNSNYTAAEDSLKGSFTVKINPAEPVFSDMDLKQWTYDGTTVANAPATSQGEDKTAPKVEYWLEDITESSLILEGVMKTADENWQSPMPVIKDAGTYILHIRLSGNNYETKTFEKHYTIGKASYTAVEGTLPQDVNEIYDGTAVDIQNSVQLKGVVEGDSLGTDAYKYTYDFKPNIESEDIHSIEGEEISAETAFTNAGTYTVYCTVEASRNYNEYSCSYTITIARKQLEKPTLDGIEYTYNGKEQTLTFNNFDTTAMNVDNATQINANEGGYSVKVSLANINNYCWKNENTDDCADIEDLNFTFIIHKAEYSVTENATTLTYTGEEQGYGITVKGVGDDISVEDATVTYSGGSGENNYNFIDAGDHEVSYMIAGTQNYNEMTGRYTIKIDKAIYEVKVEGYSSSYNGSAQGGEHSITVTTKVPEDAGKYTITYRKGESGDFVEAVPTATNVLESTTVYFRISGDKNYNDFKGQYALTITKANNKITCNFEAPENLKYDGSEHTISISDYTADFGTVSVSGDTEYKNAGDYKITLSVEETENYSGDTVEIPYNVAKADYKVTAENQEMEYSGMPQGEGVTVETYGDDEFILTYSAEGYEGGVPQFTNVKLVDGEVSAYYVEYSVNGNANYNDINGSYTITITKATLEAGSQDLTFENVVMAYGKTLGDVVSFEDPNYSWYKEKSEEFLYKENGGTTCTYEDVAIYSKENYNDLFVSITITAIKKEMTLSAVEVGFDNKYTSISDFKNEINLSSEVDIFDDEEENYIKGNLNINTPIEYSIGSTYKIEVGFNGDECGCYYILKNSYVIYKIKSVYVGDTPYTIEDALNIATSGKTITVKNNTSFATQDIAKIAGYTSPDYYTIKAGVNLLLPYDGKNYYAASGLGEGGSMSFGNISQRVIDLTISKDLTLINKGTINIGGQTTGKQGISGSTAGKYATITLCDNAKIESDGDIDAYGFIIEETYENGSELIMHKGQLKMPFIVIEHRGGTILFGAYANLQGSPFNQFFLQNVTAKLTVKSAATVVGTANLYAGSMNTAKDINLVGNDNTYLIQLQTNSKIEAKFDASKFDTAEKNVHSVTKLDIYGNATLNSLSLSMSMLGVNANLTTKGVYLPLSWYWNVTLKNTGVMSTVTATSQDIKILPGGSLTVEKNVKFNAGKIAVYTDAGFDDTLQASIKYPNGKGDGHLIVNGSMQAQVVGGLVETAEEGASLEVALANRMNTYEMNSTNGGNINAYADWKTLSHVLKLKTSTGVVAEQLSGKYVSKGANGFFDWECIESVQEGKVRLNIIPEGQSKITINAGSATYNTLGTYYLEPGTTITYTISGATENGGGAMGGTNAGGNWSILGTSSVLGNLSTSSSKKNPAVSGQQLILPESGEVTIYARSWNGNDGASCIVEGTLVMLADGTQKKVEDLQVGDMVLVFNHETGKYEAAPLLFNTHDGSDSILTTVVYAIFSDGTELGIVGEHALFDIDLNCYIFLNSANAKDYIGHRFVKVEIENGVYVTRSLTMTDVRIEEKCIKYYSPVSLFHLNVVTNSLLSYTAFVQNSQGFVNYFDYDDNMKYNEESMQADIEKYGLYTYEDFKDIMSEELFEVGPWKYFKINVGKGLLTWEDIMAELDFILHSGEV